MFFLCAGRMLAVEKNIGVVHDGLFAGTDFDGLHPARIGKVCGKNKIPVVVGAGCREHIRLARMKDQVGLAELPSRCEIRCWWKVALVTLRRALVGPALEQGDLLSGEAQLANQLELAGS